MFKIKKMCVVIQYIEAMHDKHTNLTKKRDQKMKIQYVKQMHGVIKMRAQKTWEANQNKQVSKHMIHKSKTNK